LDILTAVLAPCFVANPRFTADKSAALCFAQAIKPGTGLKLIVLFDAVTRPTDFIRHARERSDTIIYV
jgi:hypothetical protein